jgi:hypothetical protein
MVSVIAVRNSLCLTLIRLKHTRAWTRGLYCFMAINTIVLLGVIVPSLFRCRPVGAAFELDVKDAICFNKTQSIALVFSTNGNPRSVSA